MVLKKAATPAPTGRNERVAKGDTFSQPVEIRQHVPYRHHIAHASIDVE